MTIKDAEKPHEVLDLEIAPKRRLRVRTWPGHGRPLVLLHGLMDDSEGWAGLARDTHRPCYAIDLPGFGGSDVPAYPRITAYAEAVLAGLRQLDVDGGTLVGHSLGGAVATAVAERWKELHALALLAPAGYGRIGLSEFMAAPGVRHVAELALPLGLINPLVVTAAYTTFVAHHQLPSQDLVDRLRRRAFRSGPGVRVAVQALAAAGRSPKAFHRREVCFDGPVAALWGEHDALVDPEHAGALLHALPQAHVEIWKGMGHHPQRERPAELARFIERHATRGRRGHSTRRLVSRAA
jgi:pimeloyl-ACP methyl ester carboxylesterase